MTVYFSLLIAILGLLVFAISNTAKPQRIGEICFAMGLLAFLLGCGHVVRIP